MTGVQTCALPIYVDVLAFRVQRAAALIAFCRERIGTAKLQIEQAVSGLDGA